MQDTFIKIYKKYHQYDMSKPIEPWIYRITVSKVIIKEINNGTYMFYEWKNGDYRFRGMKPYYFVLKKVD